MRNTFVLPTFFLFVLLGLSGYAQHIAVPQQTNHKKSTVSLNGSWNFSPTFSGKTEKAEIVSAQWKTIDVPGEWAMQGFNVKPGDKGTYSRTFEVPAEWKNSIIYLRCDAIFSEAQIVINGKNAGEHSGPMVAFDKEVTSLLKYGKTNRITIAITAETMADTLMSGTQYAAHQLGGILRKIYLYAVPKVHLANLVIETEFGKEYNNAKLHISGFLKNQSDVSNTKITTRLFSPEGKEIALNENEKQISLPEKSEKTIQLSFAVISPLKWDAEHPNLYKLVLEVESDTGSEIIEKNIGFRKIEVVGNQVFVNGRSVKLKGVNRHEVHPLRGRSLTEKLWKQDAEIFKKGNVNYIRTSHYPPAEEFIEWCDKLGLYVELENPLCWVGHHANEHWKSNDPKNPAFYPYFKMIAKANIDFFRNHPSILIWSMGNESMWTANWSQLADFYAGEDSTRPATFHDQAYGGFNNYGSKKMPVANIHYPGTAGPRVSEDFDRPLLFGEYAHLNTYNREEIVTDPGVRDAWGRGFRKMWEGMYKSRGCLGGAIWSGIDDVFYLPDGRAVGYGEWGPIDGWRREKPEYYHIKQSYSPVKIHNQHVAVPENGKPVRLQIENRFDFTDINECMIVWEVAGEKGNVSMSLLPKQSGMLDIFPKANNLDGKIMTVRIISPQGIEVETCAIEIGNVKRDDFPFRKMEKSALSTSETENNLCIKGDGFSWSFDLTSGTLYSALVNNEKVMVAGAELMMLDLTTGPCNTEHKLEIPFHNSVCTGKKVSNVNWKTQTDTIIVSATLAYDQAEGQIKYLFAPDGTLTTNYQMKSKIKMNPRQWGLVFSVPATCKNMQWYRKGLWSWYPENHIGRTNGKAVPFDEKAFRISAFGQTPKNDWCFDANQLGTNDFRATRENIYWTALYSEKNTGLAVLSDGSQSFRAFVDGDEKISFLVTGYSSGGGDLFFSEHYTDERKKLEPGSRIESSVKIQLIKK